MARLHPNKLRAEIKSETAMTSGAYEIYRKKIVRTFMDTVDGGAPRHDYDSRLIREFNNKCDQKGFETLKINPSDAGFTYTGKGDAVPTPDFGSETNSFANPDFTGFHSTSQPNNYGKLIENFNGLTDQGQVGQDYYFHSPLFTDTTNYSSIMGSQLMSTESYNLVTDGQVIGYGDEGGNTAALAQKRVLKMFGQGTTLIDFNKRFDRLLDGSFNPVTTPMTSISNTQYSVPASGVFDTGYWVKYELCQNFGAGSNVSIPGSATGVVFGGYIKVPTGDALRDLNFGGFLLRQQVFTDSKTKTFIDVLQVKGSNFSQNSNCIGVGSYAETTGVTGNFNWGNGRVSNTVQSEGTASEKMPELFSNHSTKVRLLHSRLQSATTDWVQVSGVIPLQASDTDKNFNFGIFYAENHSYLNGDGVRAGAIHFAKPFVIFR